MADSPNGARSLLATIVGYVILALVVIWLFNFVAGTIYWILRTIIAIVVILALITLYLKLKTPKGTS